MSNAISPDDDRMFMRLALAQAQVAALAGEVPVGAMVVRAGQVVASAHNAPLGDTDPTAHAEVNAIRAAAQALGNYRLDDCTLYVTLEPCAMCSGAALHARFKRVVFGAHEPKTGAAGSVLNVFGYPQLNHQTEVSGGVLAAECAQQLQHFFEDRRLQKQLHNQLHKTPLRDDALRTPDSAWQGLDLPTDLSCFTTDLPALQGLRLHWFDNLKSASTASFNALSETSFSLGSEAAPEVYLHGPDTWSAAYMAELAGPRPAIALDLPGFGASDKPKKDKAHSLAWHAQVLVEFFAQLQPAPVALYAPHSMAPLVHAAQALWTTHQREPLHLQWLNARSALTAALREAPYPDTGHRAGPRALSALLVTPPFTPHRSTGA
ncbi:tRNA adenosine(34) deaminase TadA [Limnohabitans sp. B9-3]|uniref:tRNA adenosine(34) deaminase TadA n=1 Tax=Limnohabitans sp. B9-3 TaxID=1100707 RepID=UPI001E2B6295|nr:tRNA adenosine(34) deaminase TadA [Limnohabitans sp. B9-3]